MPAPSPEAVFDCMVVCDNLESIAGGAGELEIAHLAYLGCLLSVYSGSPPTEWGYDFAATSSAAPFSRELSNATRSLLVSGLVEDAPDGIRLTERGQRDMKVFLGLKRFDHRRLCLEAACKSATAIPLPLVTESMTAEPQLQRARELESSRSLLDEAGRHAVMEHFKALSEAVPRVADLFVPAVVWLTYLSREADKTIDDIDLGA
jgi:hypothetical protein